MLVQRGPDWIRGQKGGWLYCPCTYKKQHREDTPLDFLWHMRIHRHRWQTDRQTDRGHWQNWLENHIQTQTNLKSSQTDADFSVNRQSSGNTEWTYDLMGVFFFLAGLFWFWSSNSPRLSLSFSLSLSLDDSSNEAEVLGGELANLLELLKGSMESSKL